jgi:hypothetical protein
MEHKKEFHKRNKFFDLEIALEFDREPTREEVSTIVGAFIAGVVVVSSLVYFIFIS